MANKMSNITYDRLVYRNQFILGPSFVEDVKELKSWKKINVSSKIKLMVHQDLNTSQVIGKNKSITLIGFILDALNPQSNDMDILNDLLHNFSTCNQCFDLSNNYSGRWILIVKAEEDIILFHDAAGLRQVFYTGFNQANEIWCASQSGLIARILNLQMDEEAVDFINWYQLRDEEYWWPGDSSPFKEIKHLLPNHYLNLGTGLCYRYWPKKGLDELPLDNVIEKSSTFLSELMQGAAKRFDLTMGLSSGWDSRVLLAASRGIQHKMSYYNGRKAGMPRNHPDIEIPSRLLRKLDLKLDIIESSDIKPKSKFVEIFNNNVSFAHGTRALHMQKNLDYYNLSRVAVIGNVSELARCFYRLPEPQEQKLTGQKLSLLTNMGNHPFAIKFFEEWLLGLPEFYNFNVLDLFYWEQRAGNWFAMNCLEFDIAWQDIFVPYNTRNLLINLLSVDEKYRRPSKHELYKKLIFSLWPEVLCEPINPHKKKPLKKLIKDSFSPYVPFFVKRTIKKVLTIQNL